MRNNVEFVDRKPVGYELTITVSQRLAEALLRVVQMVGGTPDKSRRGLLTELGHVLEAAGVQDPGEELTRKEGYSGIYFKDE